MGMQSVTDAIALRLALEFHKTYEKLAPDFGYETRKDTREFDPTSNNGRLMTAVCDALIRDGQINTSTAGGPFFLHAIPDGRRSRRDTPDHVKGWQYLGMLDKNGKPQNAPKWAAERITYDRIYGTTYLHTTDSSLPVELYVGDWVIRHDEGIHAGNPRVYRLNAETVGKWYRTDLGATP